MWKETLTKFIAAAIVAKQLEVIEKYRKGNKGTMFISFSRSDDAFLDLTERAVDRLGFTNSDFPPEEAFDTTFSTAPYDDEADIARSKSV